MIAKEFSELIYRENGAFNIIGYTKTINDISLDDVEKYHAKYYTPENTVLAVVSNKKIPRSKIQPLFNIKKISSHNITDNFSVNLNKKRRLSIKYDDTEQIKLMLGFPVFGRENKKDIHALNVLLTILSRGFSSRLYQKLRVKKGYIYFIETGINNFHNLGDISFYMNVNNTALCDALDIIHDELQDIIKNPVSTDELELAKNYYTGLIFNDLQTGMDHIMNYGLQYLLSNKIVSVEEEKKHIFKVSKEDIQSVAKKYLSWDNVRISIIGKKQYIDCSKIKKLLKSGN
jgi:zinc protease